ncbi:MAG: UDP-N-acetylmuramoyl-L-alanyl-D-glutamate--2,6-diaminopimelate ligase [Gammaproteobacteria bacterium]|nr:UDP-N-acetylmuramoyl-L-alanyl-D-glutamate--2,6-diaminopimelate ligase [Gammaproteobacteria bacterium]
MDIAKLLHGFVENTEKFAKVNVTGIAVDSRQVKPGFLFFALKGHQADGERYIRQAIQNGASVILSEQPLKLNKILQIDVPDLAAHVGKIASRFYGDPSHKLMITAVTGTNGKTTIAYLLSQAHAALGKQSAYIGTLGAGIIGALSDTGMTTPGPIELQEFCHHFVLEGMDDLVMEASSHALHQHRTAGLQVKYAIYTNLSHDHLDYHPSLEHYAESKARLFQMPDLAAIIINRDDPYHGLMLKHVNPKVRIYGYGINTQADVQVKDTRWTLEGMYVQLSSPWGDVALELGLLGQFNVYNALAVFACLMAEGYELQQVLEVMKLLKPAPGRMEVCAKKPLVIVDYAHTPDALENALQTLKKFKTDTNAGDLWVVFGCGGDRDPFKRPVMGKIAKDLADFVIVTSDNPRHEDPAEIMNQITQGMSLSGHLMQIEDRKLAILTALEQAKAEDIVLIAGKGHEDYQVIGDKKIFFSDQEVVKVFLNNCHFKE